MNLRLRAACVWELSRGLTKSASKCGWSHRAHLEGNDENSYGELLAPLVKTYLGKPRRSCSIRV